MKTTELLKHSYLRTGLNQARFAMQVGVTPSYLNYIASRMEPEFKHLLPETTKSRKVQSAIKQLTEFEVELFRNNTEKVAVSR